MNEPDIGKELWQDAQGEIKALTGFKILVRRMREHQREYFRTRDRDQLVASKELERQVDNFLDNDANPNRSLI